MIDVDLVELQNRIHKQNIGLGWWDEERPFSTFVCLFHSELSEAMEGDRRGLMDDHLPEYEMFWVELADFVIRCFDYLGSKAFEGVTCIAFVGDGDDKTDCLAFLHNMISQAFVGQHHHEIRDQRIYGAATTALTFAKLENVDLIEIINKKVAYNKTRADHKRENRARDGGKKY